jgi:hypothetical protein
MMIMRKLVGERGIAGVTVLLITAVLAIAGTAVILSATTELNLGARDRRAEQAFTSAEAGIDQAAAHLFRQPTWSDDRTHECLNNPMVVDTVEYTHPTTGAVCGVLVTSSSNGRFQFPPTGKPFIDYTVASRAQEGRTVTRTLVSTYRLEALSIPFGMFVNGNLDLNGTPAMLRESLLVNGTVTSRNRLSFDWDGDGLFNDPDLGWRFHRDLITSVPVPDQCFDASTGENVGCAAVYANYQIFSRNTTRNSDEIHYPCGLAPCDPVTSSFPHDRDVHQRALDGNGNPIAVVNIPPEGILEPMPELRSLAQGQGLYFNYADGAGGTIVIQPADIGAPAREFEKNTVVYIDADGGDVIKWRPNVIPGSPDSDMLYTNDDGQRVGIDSVVLVVRGGSLHLEAGTAFSGAIFVPEGEFRTLGGNTFTGTIYAQGFTAQGGNSTIELIPEWFDRLPSGFVKVLRTQYLECEPFQNYPVGSKCAGL